MKFMKLHASSTTAGPVERPIFSILMLEKVGSRSSKIGLPLPRIDSFVVGVNVLAPEVSCVDENVLNKHPGRIGRAVFIDG